MKEIKSPERYVHDPNRRTLFLAGGITNCENWQKTVPSVMADTDLTLLNPRRGEFERNNPVMEQEQIEWEHQRLLEAGAHLFWFCEETLCPITLFELGKVIGLFPSKPLFVGTHANYERKRDIRIQMLLIRPEIEVVHSLDRLLSQVMEWAK